MEVLQDAFSGLLHSGVYLLPVNIDFDYGYASDISLLTGDAQASMHQMDRLALETSQNTGLHLQSARYFFKNDKCLCLYSLFLVIGCSYALTLITSIV